jgi:electron transfer flavoprotein alpha subunit
MVRLTAAALGVPFAGTAAYVSVRATDDERVAVLSQADGRQKRMRVLPASAAVEAGAALRPYTMRGYLDGATKAIELLPWPSGIERRPLTFMESVPGGQGTRSDGSPRALAPLEAGRLVLETLGLAANPEHALVSEGNDQSVNGPEPSIVTVDQPAFAKAGGDAPLTVVAVMASDADGRFGQSAEQTVAMARLFGQALEPGHRLEILLLVPSGPIAERRATLAVVRSFAPAVVTLLVVDRAECSNEMRSRVLAKCLSGMACAAFVGEPWTEGAFAHLAMTKRPADAVALRVESLTASAGSVVLEAAQARGKLRTWQIMHPGQGPVCWISLAEDAAVQSVAVPAAGVRTRVERWAPQLASFYACSDMRQLLAELKQATGVVRLADAEFIVDVGYGVGNRDGYEAVIEPLERALRALGTRGLMTGGSRKVTEELHLLPADRQIGQSGVSVNPRVLLAIGISGAPQHLDYIGPRATIVAFNRDPDAPIMTLNRRQPLPRVFPVVGNLFETVPALTKALGAELAQSVGVDIKGGTPTAGRLDVSAAAGGGIMEEVEQRGEA